jgi:uncharacterized protein YbaP (TraB family)
MKKAVALADRLSSASLWLVALANLLFLLAFVVTLLTLAGRAEAAVTACSGTDLRQQMATTDPAALDRIRAEAARTPNGAGLLWKIEKEGSEPSFLFGTMHMTDPRVVTLPPDAQAAFDASSTIVIETTDVLDQKKMMASFMENPELMMFTDKTTLPSLLSPEDEKLVDAALSKRGIPLASVVKMKPWVLSAMVALPACEMARKAAGEPVLDINLAQQASAQGKALGGLETAKSQLEAMASLPIAFHVQGLVETLRLGDGIDDVIETMIGIYLSGDTGMFWPFFREALPSGEAGASGYSAFEETMITARNGVMAREARPFLDKGRAFVAVGALHLPGTDGVIEQLRRDGYAVTRAD